MENWKKEFARLITQKLGIILNEDNIYPDDNWSTHIANLNDYQPIIFVHYDGMLCVTMSMNDYERLNKGKSIPERYINSSIWYYGYLKGGISYNGAYWFNFKDERGLCCNTSKITHYLQQQLQMSAYWTTRAKITMDMSDYPDFFDPRAILMIRAKQRVEAMNCKVGYITADSGKDEDNISVIKIGNMLQLSLSCHLLNQALYYPNRMNEWMQRVNELDIYCFVAYRPEKSVKTDRNFDIGAWIEEQNNY